MKAPRKRCAVWDSRTRIIMKIAIATKIQSSTSKGQRNCTNSNRSRCPFPFPAMNPPDAITQDRSFPLNEYTFLNLEENNL